MEHERREGREESGRGEEGGMTKMEGGRGEETGRERGEENDGGDRGMPL